MKKAKGISLLEMVLVIAIGAAIIMATVRYFGVTKHCVHVTHAMQQIQMLTKASYKWLDTKKQDDFSNAHGGVAISMEELVKAGLVKNSENSTKDPWKGNIIIQPGSNPSHVRVTLRQVPKEDCLNLSKRLDNSSKITPPNCNSVTNEYTGEF